MRPGHERLPTQGCTPVGPPVAATDTSRWGVERSFVPDDVRRLAGAGMTSVLAA